MQLHRDRIDHIIASYRLAGENPAAFNRHLQRLMQQFPLPWVELALVEALAQLWLRVPLQRGLSFLRQTDAILRHWQRSAQNSSITPLHFEMITGLDATPLFSRLTAG